MAGGDVLLDGKIRDWVLLTIAFVMFLSGVVRHYASKLMQSPPKPSKDVTRESQGVLRSQFLRTNAAFVPTPAFKARRSFFIAKETGFFSKGSATNPQASMMQDPTAITDMLKKNMIMVVPQFVTGAWVNFFFSGFVAAKVPFPLTQRFRQMLQRGIEMQGLDVSYVSSLSWYFINLFGMRGLFLQVLGDNPDTDDARMMQQQMNMGMQGDQAFNAEKENLEFMQHEWALPELEQKGLAVLRKFAG